MKRTLVLLAASLIGCADAGGTFRPFTSPSDGGADVGATFEPLVCFRDEDCAAHNHICNRPNEATAGRGLCGIPARMGGCTPPDPSAWLPFVGSVAGCYEGARCQPIAGNDEMGRPRGRCSFLAPQAPVFVSDRMLPKISITAPNATTVLRPTDGVSLQWTPPAIHPSTTLVAVILKNPPLREHAVNRIANANDLTWIWSSLDPGANTMPGRVALNVGYQRIDGDGVLRDRYPRSTLPSGRYWWFVFGVRDGRVSLASDVLAFRVGVDFTSFDCRSVDDCVRSIAGEQPDTVACLDGVCRRRCASDFDCPGVGGSCDLSTTQRTVGTVVPRRGGYCSIVRP